MRCGSVVMFLAGWVVLVGVAGPVVAGENHENLGRSLPEETTSDHAARPTTKWAHRDWRFFVAPYGWLAGVNGTVVTNGDETDLDIPFHDLSENVRGGFQLYFEARKNNFFLAFDGTWARLGNTIEGRFFDIDIEIQQRIYDIRAGYEVSNQTVGEPPADRDVNWRRRIISDLFIGGRYFKTAPTVKVGPAGERETVVEVSDSRVDPFVGFRVAYDFSYRWGIGLRGDIGGFGIGSAAESSWQAQLTFGYVLSKKISLFGGYRWMNFDTITGEGEDLNGQDLTQQGPTIGAGFKF